MDRGDPTDNPRPLLGIVPYAMLMLSLGVLAIAIMMLAWPGNRLPAPAQAAVATETGTAAKGWFPRQ